MLQVLLATMTGMVAGIAFAFFKLPVPAPPTFVGVAGIIGLWAGYNIINNVLQ